MRIALPTASTWPLDWSKCSTVSGGGTGAKLNLAGGFQQFATAFNHLNEVVTALGTVRLTHLLAPATLSPMDVTQIVAELKAEVNRIENAIAALLGFGGAPRRGRPSKSQSSRPASAKRTVSAAARKKIALAMKLAWAKRKGVSAPRKGAPPTKKAPAKKPMSPAMKKKMSALTKARWAARKRAGAQSL
jgi:hypothetical protein